MANKDYGVNIGYPVRTKNYIEPLICGEDAWAKVYEAINNAKKTIHLCFWALDDNIELIRKSSDISSEPTHRSQYTLYQTLLRKAKEGVKIRILLWIGFVTNSNHSQLRALSTKGVIELIYQYHPNNLIGSWHQKNIIIDEEIAFVSGMNAKEVDWDSTEHRLIDLRRAKFDCTQKERIRIVERKDYEALNQPRRDYMVYMEGEVVFDVASNFQERWNYYIEKNPIHNKATKIVLDKKKEAKSTCNAQIIRTFPVESAERHALKEDGIFQSYIKAITNAEKYIYIEDQYFRSAAIAKAIVEAKSKSKELKVIIVTPPDYLNYDSNNMPTELALGTHTTYWTSESFNIIQKADKDFVLFYLQSSIVKNNKRIFVPIDLHAKLMIVDDEWYTIGSCNIHDRGLKSDGELNISVQDSSAKELRKKIFTSHFKEECPDDINEAIKRWYKLTRDSYSLWKTKQIYPEPKCIIYSYKQTGPIKPLLTSITV